MTEHYTQEVNLYRAKEIGHPIQSILANRWSPRSMTGEELSDDELFTLFEAARWAPSSFNGQPWRFLYAKRNTPEWPLFFDLMVDANKSWTVKAAVLVVVISRTTFEHNQKPSRTHSFDAGAAWMSMALEGTARGYVVHGMEGFDYEKAKQVLNIPGDFNVEAMVAIGKRAPISALPKDLQEREQPNLRKPLQAIALRGKFH